MSVHPDQTFLNDEVIAGQAVYTDASLKYYDWLVLKISNRWVWKCPTPRLLAMYNDCVTNQHLDVGVGTGYFLDCCHFPDPDSPPSITLLDLNRASLEAAARRIERYSPQTVTANILAPLPLGETQFDSIGLNYLLHCLPGNLTTKACVFDHLIPHTRATHEMMFPHMARGSRFFKGENALSRPRRRATCSNPNGIVVGSTILSQGVKRSFFARKLMSYYNRKGIFHNERDCLEDLERELVQRFRDVQIEISGSVAIFRARLPLI